MQLKTVFLSFAFLVFFAAQSVHAGCIQAPDLSARVAEFSSNQASRVGALLRFGQNRNLCFGLEYVTPSLLTEVTDLRVHDVTVLKAIELILGEPQLEIRVDNRVIVITRRVLPADSKNLFDYVLPRFAVRRASIEEITAALYMQLRLQLNPAITGFAGHHPTGDVGDLVGPISESNRSVRYLLNMVLSESKGGMWIARVPWKLRNDLQIAERHTPWSVIEYSVLESGYKPTLDSIAVDIRSDLSQNSAGSE